MQQACSIISLQHHITPAGPLSLQTTMALHSDEALSLSPVSLSAGRYQHSGQPWTSVKLSDKELLS